MIFSFSKRIFTTAISTTKTTAAAAAVPPWKKENPFKSSSTGFIRSFGGAFAPLLPISLPATLFQVPLRRDLIHRVVSWFRAGERLGLASSKGRGQVAGSNRKIHAQKGTGRARAGDARAPHRRGGGACFGPQPRDFSFSLPLKLRWLAFRSALSEKYRLGQLSIIDPESLALPSPKTALLADQLEGFLRPDADKPKKMLILGVEPPTSPSLKNLFLASRSVDGGLIDYIQVDGNDPSERHKVKEHLRHPVTAYHLIKYHHVCMTPETIKFYSNIDDEMLK